MRTPASWWMLLGFCAAIPRFASAQAQSALDRFNPAAPSSRLLSVADPAINAWKLTPTAGALLSYADTPLVLVDQDRREIATVVDHQLILHLQASMQLRRRVELGLELPLLLSQSGQSPIGTEPSVPPQSNTALGDLRLHGHIGLLDQQGAIPAAGLLLSTWFPTGKEADYVSAHRLRMGMDVLLGADLDHWLWRASMGRRHQSDQALIPTEHSTWNLALGAAYRWNHWQLGPELYGATSADDRATAFARRTTNIEGLWCVRYGWHDLWFTVAAGPGLASGAGTPRYRALLGIAYSPVVSESSVGPKQAANSLPVQPDLVSSGAATSGREHGALQHQGTLNTGVAALPRATSSLARATDSDHDGITDRDDACPNVAGAANNEASLHGCPMDRDQDGIDDSRDACPDVKGQPTTAPTLNGCKSAVTIRGSQLVLTQQLHFRTGSDEILDESLESLEQLRQILLESPDIARVAVDGHTDDVGAESANLALSRRRALAVVRWLILNGVDERRLEARGFGPRQPLTSNQDEQGRSKNRRVEFNILRRTDRGPAGWKEGSARD